MATCLVRKYPRHIFSNIVRSCGKQEIRCISTDPTEKMTKSAKDASEKDGSETRKPPVKVEAKPLNFEEAREIAQQVFLRNRKIVEGTLVGWKQYLFGIPDPNRAAGKAKDVEWYYKRVNFWMKQYENFVGLTEVKAAQAKVIELEKNFIDAQNLRRETHAQIADISKRIKDLHGELEKTNRGEDRYLVLVTQEHQVLKEEREMREHASSVEKGERECFSKLSNAVRDSHEQERAQAEKTKYWSVIGSIIGTCIGIIGTTINNRMRMNELRKLVSQNSSVEEIRGIGDKISDNLSGHQSHLKGLVEKVQDILTQTGEGMANISHVQPLVQSLKESSDKINIQSLEEVVGQLYQRQVLLSDVISQYEAAIDEKIEEIKTQVVSQNDNVVKLTQNQVESRKDVESVMKEKIEEQRKIFEALVHQNKNAINGVEFRTRAIDEKQKKNFDALVKQNTNVLESVELYSKEMDDKLKDVRSLLIHANQVPKIDPILVKRLESLEKGQRTLGAVAGHVDTVVSEELLEQMDTRFVNLLSDHQEKTRKTVFVSGLIVAALTPLAVYTANRFL